MLRITVELVPHGREEHKRTIATGIIFNDGTGDFDHGNYVAEFKVDRDHMTGKPISLSSTVKKFHRVRNVWSLICEAISNIKE
jgi:hypothetical protein